MEGRIIAAKRSRRASPFGQLCATIIKVRVQEQSSRHVDRTGKPCEPWDKTDRNQSESRKRALPSHETNSSLPARKNQIARPLVVLAIHPCNGHEVRELPRKSIEKSIHASKLSLPDAAAQPISGGIAPGKAPTSVHSGVLLLRGVY